jgi:hypothetical protein
MDNLTEDQKIAINSVLNFLNSNDEIFTLSGIGGAGKTFAIKEALKSQSNVVAATVSHSAKFVLQESLKGTRVECYTIAQLLGLKQFIDEDGEITFKPSLYSRGNLPINFANLLLIDECSMIDEETYNMIKMMKNPGTKIIFLGDKFQLAPINGVKESPSFNYIKAELTKPIRYTGPILDLGSRIREEQKKLMDGLPCTKHIINEWMTSELQYEYRTSMVNEEGSGFIFLNDIEKAIEIAVNAFKNSEDPDDMRLIAYRNSTIKKVNSAIRTELYCNDNEGEGNLSQFMPGEIVICNGGYSVEVTNVDGSIKFHPSIFNNQTFRVNKTHEINGPFNVPCLSMDLIPNPPRPNGSHVYVLDYEKGRYSYYEKINALKREAKEDGKQWPRYYAFKERFAEFDYGYSSSAHKSQGRTFKDVIVFERDIFDVTKNSLLNKMQAFYVACTRAKRRVYIFNSKYKVDQSLLPEFIRKELGI